MPKNSVLCYSEWYKTRTASNLTSSITNQIKAQLFHFGHSSRNIPISLWRHNNKTLDGNRGNYIL